jgi:hypothetical protein
MFTAKTYCCWELTFASNYCRSTSIKVMAVTRTPILQTSQKWHNHSLNKTVVKQANFFFRNSRIICRASFLYLSLSHGITSPNTPHSSHVFSARERTVCVVSVVKEHFKDQW